MHRLVHIALGHKIRTGPGRKTYPSETLQMQALNTLAGKIVPNLQSQTVDLTSRVETEDFSDLELAKWITAKLSIAIPDDGEKEPPAIEADDTAALPEHFSGEQSQGNAADRAAERLAVSKSIAPPPPADPQQRLNDYINQQIEAQRTRPRVLLRAGPRRR